MAAQTTTRRGPRPRLLLRPPLSDVLAKIRDRMVLTNATQADIAERAFGARENQSYVSGLLSGQRPLTRVSLQKIAEALACRPVDLDPTYKDFRRVTRSAVLDAADSEAVDTQLLSFIDVAIGDLEERRQEKMIRDDRYRIVVLLHNELRGTPYTQHDVTAALYRSLEVKTSQRQE